MRLVISVIVLGALWASAAAGQTRQDIERCREIGDDRLRLQCYDAIYVPANRLTRSKYETLDLAELESYPLSYRGRLVEVRGWLTPSEDIFVLRAGPEAGESVPVEADALSRRDREAILAACREGCEAVIQGKVGPVNFVTGIIADTISPD